MSTCALLAKLNRLNTKDKTSRWNNSIDRFCVFCSTHNEDKDHLFFNCVYSRQFLETIMHKLQINLENSFEFDQILNIICQNQKGNVLFNQIKYTAFTVVIWNIWCKRNSRVFKNIELPVQVRMTLIIQDCKHLLRNKLDAKKLSREG